MTNTKKKKNQLRINIHLPNVSRRWDDAMNIKTFSKLSNISAHTLRYYEKIGLLKRISRTSSGHRFFTQEDSVWVEFIKRLKDTGMSIKHIQKYAELRELGPQTSVLRMQLLQEHTALLKQKIALESAHLQKLDEKIDYYHKLINE